jgi:hypothetical protein
MRRAESLELNSGPALAVAQTGTSGLALRSQK